MLYFFFNFLDPLASKVIYVLFYLWIFYALYVLTMGVYRAKLAGRLAGVPLLLLYPFVVIAVIADVLCQLTIASVIFLEWPRTCWQRTTVTIWRWSFDLTYFYVEPLVTTRLKRLHASDEGWRAALASYVCQNLLDPFDPDGDHC